MMARTTKRERQLETAYNTVRKQFPGKKPLWDLDRMALLLDHHGYPEDAEALRSLADRLLRLRALLRGKSRDDYAREANDRLRADWTPEERTHLERPFT